MMAAEAGAACIVAAKNTGLSPGAVAYPDVAAVLTAAGPVAGSRLSWGYIDSASFQTSTFPRTFVTDNNNVLTTPDGRWLFT
jgi:hypothetical protein